VGVESSQCDGKVLVVDKLPEFKRDILPFFQSSLYLILSLVVVVHSRNYMLPLWMLYILRPLKYYFAQEENENLNQSSDKAFLKDKRFYYPLHTYVGLESLAWIWGLVVCSDSINIESPWFDGIKPHTLGEWFQFSLVMGYFAGLNAIVGHELVHKREWYNKLLGTFSYTKFMYSHFLQEHIHGHHKDVATPNDPCSADYGESVYQFIPKSFFGQHLQSW